MYKHNCSGAILSFLMFFLFCASIAHLQESTTDKRKGYSLRITSCNTRELVKDTETTVCEFSINADQWVDLKVDEITVWTNLQNVCLAVPCIKAYVDKRYTIPITGVGSDGNITPDGVMSITTGDNRVIFPIKNQAGKKTALKIPEGEMLYFRYILEATPQQDGVPMGVNVQRMWLR